VVDTAIEVFSCLQCFLTPPHRNGRAREDFFLSLFKLKREFAGSVMTAEEF
jgi:hypothetical protein